VRSCVKIESSMPDSAPGEMIEFASRKAHTCSSARLTRASASCICFSMYLRASMMRAFLIWRL
jgi:hypothetical protein